MARLIMINEYLDLFSRLTRSDKIGVNELNIFLLNSVPNSWSKEAYVQGFDCDSIDFKKSVNRFERMEIV